MKTKVCTRCKEDKAIDQYYKTSLTMNSMCRKCSREYNKERYAKQKKILQESKW